MKVKICTKLESESGQCCSVFFMQVVAALFILSLVTYCWKNMHSLIFLPLCTVIINVSEDTLLYILQRRFRLHSKTPIHTREVSDAIQINRPDELNYSVFATVLFLRKLCMLNDVWNFSMKGVCFSESPIA